ncbi:MAG: AMIN domain-containing protein [Candidatus Rokubacteria bacterium]|nr:AMIN domain-containing protein [Candidatus Rokubacteria bacterium]
MNTRRRIPGVLLAVSFALVPFAPTVARAQSEPARLSDVTVTSQPDAVTVLVKTSREPKYTAELIDGPTRLVVDLEDTQYAWRKTPLAVGLEPLKQIRGSQYRKGVARLVFEFTRKTGYAIREDGDGLAIIIPAAKGDAAGRVTRVAEIKAPAPAAAPEAPAARPSAPEARRAPVQLAQAPAAPPAPAPAVPSGPRLISFDFKDADVVNLLRILAAESTRNIVIGDDVKGKMSISLRNVPWELALDTVLETRGLRKIEKDGVIRIVSTDQLLKEREGAARVEEAKLKAETELKTKAAEARIKEQEAIDKQRAAEAAVREAQARGPLREETIRLAYADPEEIARTLQGILGIPPEGVQAAATPIGGPPPIGEPPFSALYGGGGRPGGGLPMSPSAEVLAKGITIRAHKPTNSIFIRHYEADLERIKKLVREKLDVPLPQVRIEARMEILDRVDLYAIGVQWGGGRVTQSNSSTIVGRGFTSSQGFATGIGPALRNIENHPGGVPNPNLTLATALPSTASGLPSGGNLVNIPISDVLGGIGSSITSGAGGIVFGIVQSRMNLNLALEALKTQRKTRTLARPEIVTMENYKATMSLGEEIPYATVSSAGTQVQFKEALLKLEVTPTVVQEGDVTRIKMLVVVENNSRGTTVDFGTAGNPPAIDKRKAETLVLIKEGDRLVIGGVTKNVDDEFERKVPLFGDIPLLGWLFKSRATGFTGRELIVFITPSVIKTDIAKASTPKQ